MSQKLTYLLLILAPMSVIVSLETFSNVVVTFAIYQIGVCLLIPAADCLIGRRIGWSGYLRCLGLGSGTGFRPCVTTGVMTGTIFGAAIVAGAHWWPELIESVRTDGTPGATGLAHRLAAWSIEAGNARAVLLFMVLISAPAEELFWRGYIHDRMSEWRTRGIAMGLASVAYASYHLYTVFRLVDNTLVVFLFSGIILLAGLVLAWLRERTKSVWAPLLAHLGAAAGYMFVFWERVVG